MNDKKIKSIPEGKGFYIAGFADGEGSFNVSFRKRDDFLIGWKVSPVFNITQKEKTILALIKQCIGCGTIRFRSDNVWVYEVDNLKSIKESIIPFFKRFPFISDKKKKDFARFQKIVKVKEEKKSLTYKDLESLLELLREVESKNSRKYNDSEIKERACLFFRRRKKTEKRLKK